MYPTRPPESLAPVPRPHHFPVLTASGRRTCVSIPRERVASYVETWGSRAAFRVVLNEAARAVEPRCGYSRSQLVRIALDAVQASAQAQAR